MCGIIGAISRSGVEGMLLNGLAHMEYRGYDSAGICVRSGNHFRWNKQPGKLHHLIQALGRESICGEIGIGHTRWATHGAPNKENAHPHLSDRVALVHNGIIENHQQLRAELILEGATFASETDTEVIPWLFSRELATTHATTDDLVAAWRGTLNQLRGTYALAAMVAEDDDRLWFARQGSPLLLGRNEAAVFTASDALALAGLASEVLYLEEGEYGFISLDRVAIWNKSHEVVAPHWRPSPVTSGQTGKGGFEHYMEKEIHEQPQVVSDILNSYLSGSEILFPAARFLHSEPLPTRIVMVACGTSYHAALTARYWIERYLKISVEVDVASEYRYRDPVIGDNTWLITISQSGETADTLEALRLFKRKTPENRTLTLCNVPHSSLGRESEGMIELKAGPEIGVASTKAFTAQLTVLALLTLMLSRRFGAMGEVAYLNHILSLRSAVGGLSELVAQSGYIATLTHLFMQAHGALFLGRGPCYPLALEGALKLKEISYLHAEGYAAGEMKHGPIALIDDKLPVIVLAPSHYDLDKVLSNLQEVRARGARVILLTDLAPEQNPQVRHQIRIPVGDYFSTPLLAVVPMQLLAYHVARAKGTDVDQPRNLAKSVTVE